MDQTTASEQIDQIIQLHGGWKGETLIKLRQIIRQADPQIVEEVKWKTASRPEGLPVWYHHGILCLAEVWKNDVKLIFTKGAQLDDPLNLFNARLKSSTDRAIELREGDTVNAEALEQLLDQAISLNKQKS